MWSQITLISLPARRSRREAEVGGYLQFYCWNNRHIITAGLNFLVFYIVLVKTTVLHVFLSGNCTILGEVSYRILILFFLYPLNSIFNRLCLFQLIMAVKSAHHGTILKCWWFIVMGSHSKNKWRGRYPTLKTVLLEWSDVLAIGLTFQFFF